MLQCGGVPTRQQADDDKSFVLTPTQQRVSHLKVLESVVKAIDDETTSLYL